jgi:hypothetical protein
LLGGSSAVYGTSVPALGMPQGHDRAANLVIAKPAAANLAKN